MGLCEDQGTWDVHVSVAREEEEEEKVDARKKKISTDENKPNQSDFSELRGKDSDAFELWTGLLPSGGKVIKFHRPGVCELFWPSVSSDNAMSRSQWESGTGFSEKTKTTYLGSLFCHCYLL
ncbi:hypothetical protein STEG23_036233 [Scotinomys teguina]